MREFLISIGEASYIFFISFLGFFKGRPKFYHFIQRMVYIGFESVPVVVITSLFTGGVLALQSYSTFHRFSAEYLIGALVAISMGRELGPVLTSLMVIARVGSAITASIGTMKVTQQIDALEIMAFDPYKYLGSPILLAFLVDLPLLTLLSDISGIFGGYFVSTRIFHVNSYVYWEKMRQLTTFHDIYGGLYKAIVYAIVVSTVSLYFGFNVKGGNEGVGRATTNSVVLSSMLVLVLDYFTTAIIFT